jgi:ABC-type ATPase with predicted acetyltransferase domain
VSVAYNLNPKTNSYRTQRAKDAYGIDFDVGELTVIDDVAIELEPGQIVFAVGSSGAGKTSYCRALADSETVDAIDFGRIEREFPRETPIIDCFPEDFDVEKTQLYMSMFGLGEAHLNLREYDELSDGQQYRARLCYAAAHYPGRAIFADEFCATLDRPTAKTISYSLRKSLLKDRLDNTFVLATTHRDILYDLQPDWLLDFDENAVKNGVPAVDPVFTADESADAEHQEAFVVTMQAAFDADEVVDDYKDDLNTISPINPTLPDELERHGRTSLGGIMKTEETGASSKEQD